jgi:UTP--glucose-1-phosphate uridylyltransferase
MSKTTVRKAIVPVAGFGTRMLPATKALPKEMLPVVDKPIIQYIVEECAQAGINEIVMVTHKAKVAIQRHFEPFHELEASLARRGKDKALAEVQSTLPDGVKLHFVEQGEAKGLGHAVLCGKDIIGDEPFAVILPDVLIETDVGVDNLKEMIAAFQESAASQIMVEPVPHEDISKFGIVDLNRVILLPGEHCKMVATVEKPDPHEAPSNMAVVGRYIFASSIWNKLETTGVGVGGEIQLTDAMDDLLHDEDMHAFYMRGRSHDCGNKRGYLRAIQAFASRRMDF